MTGLAPRYCIVRPFAFAEGDGVNTVQKIRGGEGSPPLWRIKDEKDWCLVFRFTLRQAQGDVV